jgi:hypothetical protein
MRSSPRPAQDQQVWSLTFRALKWVAIGIPIGILALVLLAIVSLFVGNPVSYVTVTHQPESQLFYPGSILVRQQALGERDGLVGDHYPAFVSSVLKTDASPTAIRTWYREQLVRTGWTEDGDGLAYHRPGRRVLLFFVYGAGSYGYAFGFTDCGGKQPCRTDFPPI